MVAGPATLSNSYNLHKSKMVAMNAIKSFVLPIVIECCPICLYRVFWYAESISGVVFAIKCSIIHVTYQRWRPDAIMKIDYLTDYHMLCHMQYVFLS